MKKILIFRTANFQVIRKNISHIINKYKNDEVEIYCLVQKSSLKIMKSKYEFIKFIVIDDGFFKFFKNVTDKRIRKILKENKFDEVYLPTSHEALYHVKKLLLYIYIMVNSNKLNLFTIEGRIVEINLKFIFIIENFLKETFLAVKTKIMDFNDYILAKHLDFFSSVVNMFTLNEKRTSNKSTFVTVSPECENVFLIKDVGRIPYVMYKEHNYDSYIACYSKEDFPYLYNEAKGLKIMHIENKYNDVEKDVRHFLKVNARKIDVLHLYFYSARTFRWIITYKLHNKKGKVYLKLDASTRIMNTNLGISYKKKTVHYLLNKCSLVSTEAKPIYDYLNSVLDYKIELSPNGFFCNEIKPIEGIKKNKTILTVGRSGTYQKATEILLEGFKEASEKIKGWNLRIVGTVEDDFKVYIDEFFKKNPDMIGRIDFLGPIYDRNKLMEEYRNSEIFCIPSRYESFSLATVEAISEGCYLIATDIPCFKDMAMNEKHGKLFKVDDVEGLSNCFKQVCKDGFLKDENFQCIKEYAYKNYSWTNICKKINESLV